LALSNPKSSYC